MFEALGRLHPSMVTLLRSLSHEATSAVPHPGSTQAPLLRRWASRLSATLTRGTTLAVLQGLPMADDPLRGPEDLDVDLAFRLPA